MSTRRLILHEDRYWRLLRPLTDLLPVPALAFGASDLARRWIARSGLPLFAIEARAAAMACWADAPVRDTAAIATDDEAVVVNAAALPGPWFDAVLAERSPALFLCGSRVAAARVPLAMLRGGIGRGEDFETVLLGLALPTHACEASFIEFRGISWRAIPRRSSPTSRRVRRRRRAPCIGSRRSNRPSAS